MQSFSHHYCCSVDRLCLTLLWLQGLRPTMLSVYGISQARILTISFSRRSFPPRNQAHICCIGRQVLYHWATRRRLLRVPWTARRSNPKGDQSWVFIGRTDVEAETLILWPPDAKNWLIGEDPDTGKDWRQEEKGTTEDEMVGWHHRLNGHELE